MPGADVHWYPAYVALGSNLDGPRKQVESAFAALAQLRDSKLVLRSALYRTPPFGPVPQPDFVNAVAGMLTQLDPTAFLAALKSTERQLGRAAPAVRWGPRRIDLDLLVHGNCRTQSPELTLPHPGLAERAFVLAPLSDVAPGLVVPGLGRTVAELLRSVDTSGLEPLSA